jgi:hypothetical protein
MNGAIFFASKYGSTAQYAEWIAPCVQQDWRRQSTSALVPGCVKTLGNYSFYDFDSSIEKYESMKSIT